MIRVAIVAATLERARDFAETLSQSHTLEILHAGVPENDVGADVTLAVGLNAEDLAHLSAPIVALGANQVATRLGRRIRAILPLDASLHAIEAALLAAAQDLLVLTREQSRLWLRTEALETDAMPVEALTVRELQVLRAIADGMPNKEIAARLRMSEHTAKFHVSQILAKLGAASRAEAVATGIRRGWIPL